MISDSEELVQRLVVCMSLLVFDCHWEVDANHGKCVVPDGLNTSIGEILVDSRNAVREFRINYRRRVGD